MTSKTSKAIRDQGRSEAQIATEQRVADYAETFSTEAGKRVFYDLRKSYCGTMDGIDNSTKMAIAIGKREVVKDIEAVIRLSKRPDVIQSMFEVHDFDPLA